MPRRFPASSAFALLAFFVSALARADVPPADGGSVDFDCTVSIQSMAGRTCSACLLTSSDTSCALELGSDYNFVCQYSATVQVWCNGPPRTPVSSSSCALGGSPAPPDPTSGAVMAALLGVAAWARRRRSR